MFGLEQLVSYGQGTFVVKVVKCVSLGKFMDRSDVVCLSIPVKSNCNKSAGWDSFRTMVQSVFNRDPAALSVHTNTWGVKYPRILCNARTTSA